MLLCIAAKMKEGKKKSRLEDFVEQERENLADLESRFPGPEQSHHRQNKRRRKAAPSPPFETEPGWSGLHFPSRNHLS